MKLFGTDGVRGKAGEKLSAQTSMRLAMAAGIYFRKTSATNVILVGKDTRKSGYMIETAIVAGLTAVGYNVLQIGPMPTPAIAFLTENMRCDAGIMISASHNPYYDNGIKFFDSFGNKLDETIEAEIEKIFYDDELTPYAGFLPTVAGGNFSIPRRVYLEAGGMDSSYKSSEETDFAWRVQLAGVPAALTHGPLLHYILRDKPKRIFHQQRAYQKYKVLLWVHYRQYGMRGPSTKASILEILRQVPKLINPATRFRAAYLAGGNIGALEGILQYRVLKRIPKPLRLDTAPVSTAASAL